MILLLMMLEGRKWKTTKSLQSFVHIPKRPLASRRRRREGENVHYEEKWRRSRRLRRGNKLESDPSQKKEQERKVSGSPLGAIHCVLSLAPLQRQSGCSLPLLPTPTFIIIPPPLSLKVVLLKSHFHSKLKYPTIRMATQIIPDRNDPSDWKLLKIISIPVIVWPQLMSIQWL